MQLSLIIYPLSTGKHYKWGIVVYNLINFFTFRYKHSLIRQQTLDELDVVKEIRHFFQDNLLDVFLIERMRQIRN